MSFARQLYRRSLLLAPLVLAILGLQSSTNGYASEAEAVKRTMIVWHVEPTQAARDVLDEIARKLEAANPNLKIVVENKPWLTLGSELALAISQGRSPDLAMVEPYMTASLVDQKLIDPLDSLYAELGREDFYPFLREMNTFNGKLYGIPHAFGVGYFSYRADLLQRAGGVVPKTFAELIANAELMKKDFAYPVLLCGGTNFLLDQLFVSMVASNGGHMFDPNTGRPLLDSPQVVETLTWFDKLAALAPPDWKSRAYQDTFVAFAKGKAGMVPLTAARTINQIAADADPAIADAQHFAVFHTPIGPSGKTGYTFIDAEPWVIFSKSQHKAVARAFLKEFYADGNYLRFCRAVPLHLTPSRISLHDRYFSDPFLTKWRSWSDLQVKIVKEGLGFPLMCAGPAEHRLPFLWEVYDKRIITDMLTGTGTPAERARTAQQKAERLIDSLGYRKW